ncbi:MAG: hypothetical protein KDI06_11505 [Calditrichaeota bacterium]|nr:hypothetical protein [Calditrichota bacterium]HQU71759.1 hypothetical protein [Calditrichia bacterium]
MQNRRLIRQTLVGVFFLGVILFNPPFLGIFNSEKLVFGIPMLFFYIFSAWALLIVVTGWVVRKRFNAAQE